MRGDERGVPMDDSDKGMLIKELKRLKALEFGDFVLASGKRSSYYVNIKRAITEPGFLRMAASLMAPLVTDAGKLAGVELGAVPLVVALSIETDKPYLIVRKERKEHGTKGAFEGTVERGERILFIEDVTTTANTLKSAILMIRDHGGMVDKALCVVDRNEGAVENLSSIGVRLVPLVSADELLREREV